MRVSTLWLVRWGALRIPALVLGVLAVVLTWEALQVAFASPEQIAEYRFGSEAMLYHGGPHYRSQFVYVLSGLAVAAALFSLSGLLAVVSRQSSRWFWSSLVPFALALAAGAAMMLAAWQHNPQGEIHTEAGVAWLYWLSIGASWCVRFYAVGHRVQGHELFRTKRTPSFPHLPFC